MNDNIAQAFSNCIDRLVAGETVEDCLALYPESAAELEPLLRTAGATLRVTRLVPDRARKEAAKRRFLETVQSEAPSRRNLIVFPTRMRAIAACLAAAFLLMVAMSGAMVVSADSTPDDPLYPMKRAAERVQLLFARDDDETALHLELADRRLSELEAIAGRRGAIDISLLAEMVKETDEVVVGLDKTDNKNEKLAEQLLSLTSRQQEVLRKVALKAPEEAAEGLERAMERSKQGYDAASTAIARGRSGERQDEDKDGPTSPSPSSTASSPGPTIDHSVGKAGDSRSDDDKGGDDRGKERDRSLTPRAGTPPRQNDDDAKQESTSHLVPEATPVRSPTARPTETRSTAQPTIVGRKEKDDERKSDD